MPKGFIEIKTPSGDTVLVNIDKIIYVVPTTSYAKNRFRFSIVTKTKEIPVSGMSYEEFKKLLGHAGACDD